MRHRKLYFYLFQILVLLSVARMVSGDETAPENGNAGSALEEQEAGPQSPAAAPASTNANDNSPMTPEDENFAKKQIEAFGKLQDTQNSSAVPGTPELVEKLNLAVGNSDDPRSSDNLDKPDIPSDPGYVHPSDQMVKNAPGDVFNCKQDEICYPEQDVSGVKFWGTRECSGRADRCEIHVRNPFDRRIWYRFKIPQSQNAGCDITSGDIFAQLGPHLEGGGICYGVLPGPYYYQLGLEWHFDADPKINRSQKAGLKKPNKSVGKLGIVLARRPLPTSVPTTTPIPQPTRVYIPPTPVPYVAPTQIPVYATVVPAAMPTAKPEPSRYGHLCFNQTGGCNCYLQTPQLIGSDCSCDEIPKNGDSREFHHWGVVVNDAENIPTPCIPSAPYFQGTHKYQPVFQ
jgi:hypothetical protein